MDKSRKRQEKGKEAEEEQEEASVWGSPFGPTKTSNSLAKIEFHPDYRCPCIGRPADHQSRNRKLHKRRLTKSTRLLLIDLLDTGVLRNFQVVLKLSMAPSKVHYVLAVTHDGLLWDGNTFGRETDASKRSLHSEKGPRLYYAFSQWCQAMVKGECIAGVRVPRPNGTQIVKNLFAAFKKRTFEGERSQMVFVSVADLKETGFEVMKKLVRIKRADVKASRRSAESASGGSDEDEKETKAKKRKWASVQDDVGTDLDMRKSGAWEGLNLVADAEEDLKDMQETLKLRDRLLEEAQHNDGDVSSVLDEEAVRLLTALGDKASEDASLKQLRKAVLCLLSSGVAEPWILAQMCSGSVEGLEDLASEDIERARRTERTLRELETLTPLLHNNMVRMHRSDLELNGVPFDSDWDYDEEDDEFVSSFMDNLKTEIPFVQEDVVEGAPSVRRFSVLDLSSLEYVPSSFYDPDQPRFPNSYSSPLSSAQRPRKTPVVMPRPPSKRPSSHVDRAQKAPIGLKRPRTVAASTSSPPVPQRPVGIVESEPVAHPPVYFALTSGSMLGHIANLVSGDVLGQLKNASSSGRSVGFDPFEACRLEEERTRENIRKLTGVPYYEARLNLRDPAQPLRGAHVLSMKYSYEPSKEPWDEQEDDCSQIVSVPEQSADSQDMEILDTRQEEGDEEEEEEEEEYEEGEDVLVTTELETIFLPGNARREEEDEQEDEEDTIEELVLSMIRKPVACEN